MGTRAPLRPGELSPWREVPASIPRPEYVGKQEPRRSEPDRADPRRDRADAPRPAGSPPRPSCSPVSTASPASPPTTSTGWCTSSSATTAPTRRRWATRAFPSPAARASTRSSATASRTRRCIEDGDIVNVDVTAFLDGVHGDTNQTFCVGEVSEEARLLVERTREATMRGVKAVAPGPAAQRDRPGHRGVRQAVRVRRGARLRRPRHRRVVPLRAVRAALRQPEPGRRDGARA